MSFLSSIPAPVGVPGLAPDFSLRSRLTALIAQIQPALTSDADVEVQPLRVLDAALTDFLLAVAPPLIPAAGGLAPRTMKRVILFIDSNIGTSITISTLATIAGLSKSHFYRTFATSFGVSPHTFLMQRRIERAQDLISQTDEPLAEIALSCGLSDQAHLTRLFRRFAGITPGQWRRRSAISAVPSPLAVLDPALLRLANPMRAQLQSEGDVR